jgi:hypothetical protein
MIRTHGFPNWQVVNAHVATSPKRPQTIHYRGDGEFMISGDLDQPPMEGQTGKPLTMPSPDRPHEDDAALIRRRYEAVNRKALKTIAGFGAPASEWLDVPFSITST